MEFRTRCRIIPALFALTFCTVPVLAQEEPDLASSEDIRSDPNIEQDSFAQRPGAPRGQPQPPGFRNDLARGGGFAPPGQPGFGQPGLGFSPLIMQSPEMAKKMRAIMVLRQMWQLRLSAKDISAVLLPLRELAEAEKSLQVRSERILEEERRALLNADPDGDPPEGVGDLMQRENDLFRIKSDDTWRAIDKSIGKTKTNGMRRLLGMGGQVASNNLGAFGRLEGKIDWSIESALGGFEGGGTPRSTPPGGGEFGPDGGRAGGGVADSRPRQNRASNGDGRGDMPPANARQSLPSPGGAASGFGAATVRQYNPYNPQGMSMMPQVRVSITEFVGLLGEKLAAMRK